MIDALVTSGSPTDNSDGSFTIDNTGPDRVRCPEARTIFSETRGWYVARIRPTWASGGTLPGSSPFAFHWGDAAFNTRIALFFGSASLLQALRDDGTSSGAASQAGSFASGDSLIVAAKWDAGAVYVSIEGANWTTNSPDTNIPALTSNTFDIGNFSGGDRSIMSPVEWAIAGADPDGLLNADLAALQALSTDPDFSTLPDADMRFLATFDDLNYETPFQKIRPDADTADGGWTTTPLWSKVEETSADGTVITATAA